MKYFLFLFSLLLCLTGCDKYEAGNEYLTLSPVYGTSGSSGTTGTETSTTVLVNSITLSSTSLSLTVGSSQTLTATVSPSNATTPALTWSSGNTSVATVSTSGVVTARSTGTTTITAAAADGSGVKATCTVTVKNSTVLVTSIALSSTTLSLVTGMASQLTASVSPSNATDKSVSWSTSNSSVATVSSTGLVTAVSAGTATITATAADGSGVKATCMATVGPSSGTTNGHVWVNLGLSVKWATMNVGASSPEDYGDYFAWGETTTKATYNWSTYKYCNGSSTTMTKYCTSSSYGTVDNKTVLDLSDDAARANWGGTWRMPTDAELTELRTNCTWTWTTQNGVNGYKVTSKTNGNSIFLPAAGYRDDSSLGNAGSSGYYWSSSLNESSPYYAWYVYFYSGDVSRSDRNRFGGQSVRPVCQ